MRDHNPYQHRINKPKESDTALLNETQERCRINIGEKIRTGNLVRKSG